MEIKSISPIHLEIEDEFTKTTIIQDKDEYLHISFLDDTDDALSVPQITKIHPVDLPNFVNLINRAVNFL